MVDQEANLSCDLQVQLSPTLSLKYDLEKVTQLPPFTHLKIQSSPLQSLALSIHDTCPVKGKL